MARAKKIKLIATDLDRTFLSGTKDVSPENREAFEACAENGIILVAATGRALSAVPEPVRNIKGMRYVICTNGAKIYDNATNKELLARYLSPEAVEYALLLLNDEEVLCEFFWGGKPRVQRKRYENPSEIPDWFLSYFLGSREPVDDILSAVRAHANEMENINFVFGSETVKKRVAEHLNKRPELYELTSSMPFNFEIGGVGVTKATAVEHVCKLEGLSREEALSFGDSENDATLLEWTGLAIAMENGVPSTKKAADYITEGNESSGVAKALKALQLY